MNFQHFALIASLVLSQCAASEWTSAAEPGTIRIEKSARNSPSFGEIEYELGTLYVPENRSEPTSRVISIGFARYATTAKDKRPPIFVLPGGPGFSYVEPFADPLLQAHSRSPENLLDLTKISDVIFVDQRGCSNRGDAFVYKRRDLPKSPDEPYTVEDYVSAHRSFAKSVMEEYQDKDVDLRGYTVLECADDVRSLRDALGYDKIMLWGGSFGSRWSFAVMKRHPQIVERAVLSGVSHLDSNFALPSHAFAAAKRTWKLAEKDKRFAPYLAECTINEAADSLMKRLGKNPRITTSGNFLGFKYPKTLRTIGPADFPWDYSPKRILEMSHEHWGNLASRAEPETSTAPLINTLMEVSLGMTDERLKKARTDPMRKMCPKWTIAYERYVATKEIWPDADIGDEYRRPFSSDVPTVFIQGDCDQITPIENTQEIAPYFKKHHVVVMHGGTHATLHWTPSLAEGVRDFLESSSIENLPKRIDVPVELDAPTFELSPKSAADTKEDRTNG